MEYISDGFSLCHVPAEECPVALSASHGLGQARLWSLGRVLAMDMLVNNFDRFPLVWDNEGNAGNVMLTPLDDVVVGRWQRSMLRRFGKSIPSGSSRHLATIGGKSTRRLMHQSSIRMLLRSASQEGGTPVAEGVPAGDSALGNGLAGVVPIDQPVMCITSPVLLERYCARVSAVLESLVRRPSAVGAPDDVFYNAVIRCLKADVAANKRGAETPVASTATAGDATPAAAAAPAAAPAGPDVGPDAGEGSLPSEQSTSADADAGVADATAARVDAATLSPSAGASDDGSAADRSGPSQVPARTSSEAIVEGGSCCGSGGSGGSSGGVEDDSGGGHGGHGGGIVDTGVDSGTVAAVAATGTEGSLPSPPGRPVGEPGEDFPLLKVRVRGWGGRVV